MVKRMKAAVYYGVKDLRLENREVPKINDDEILVRVRAAGLCATDLRIYAHGSSSVKPPVVLGHEFAGEIVEVGKNVPLEKKQKVNIPADAYCGVCELCRKGHENLCSNAITFGYNIDGAFAEFVRVPSRFIKQNLVFPIDGLSYDVAAMIEPLACVLEGARHLQIEPADQVLVIGDGPIGLMHVEVASALGAKVIISGTSSEKLRIAREVGAEYAININEKDPIKEVVEYTNGGADAVIVAVSSVAAIEQAFKMVRKAGRILLFAGVPRGKMITIDPNIIHYGEVKVLGSSNYTRDTYFRAVEMAKRLNLEKLISATFPLSKISEAMELGMSKKALKIIIHP